MYGIRFTSPTPSAWRFQRAAGDGAVGVARHEHGRVRLRHLL